jgi:DNA excision repair protein ERCC-5
MKPEVDRSTEAFQWGVPDVEGLRHFLSSTIGWSKERTDEVLVPVVKDMNRRDAEGTQANITRYFEGGVGVGAKEAFAPRQHRAKGSKRMADAVSRLRANAAGEPPPGLETSARDNGDNASTARTGRKRKKRQSRVVDDEDDGDDANGDVDEQVADGTDGLERVDGDGAPVAATSNKRSNNGKRARPVG